MFKRNFLPWPWSVVYVLLVLAAIATSVNITQAATAVTRHYAVNSSWTLKLDDQAKLGVYRQAFDGSADITWEVYQAHIPRLPKPWVLVSAGYRFNITGVTSFSTIQTRPLAVAIPVPAGSWLRQMWLYDFSIHKWQPLPSTYDVVRGEVRGNPKILNGLIVIGEDRRQQEGIASWYCRISCSSRYPKMHGTSNYFPVGSTVVVRSLETSRTINVKIVSGWGQPAGRIIDLSGAAYDKLKVQNRGVTPVRVSTTAVAQTTSVKNVAVVTNPNEVLPALKLQNRSSSAPPSLVTPAYQVYDQTTNTILGDKNSQQHRSIASLTKLMTAAVYLDTKPDLRKTIVTYRSTDRTGYDYLRVRLGDTMTARDLFYAMLVGSANNAATALVRSTGLSQADFVAKMNTKAATWGLTDSKFVDVTGLDPGNVATADDISRLAAQAFHEYEPIRYVTTRSSYGFTTINTKQPHYIKSTDKLLTSTTIPDPLKITGGKTGYIDEAGYTYVLRLQQRQTGAQFIITLLGSPTTTVRWQEAVKLMNWATTNYNWQLLTT